MEKDFVTKYQHLSKNLKFNLSARGHALAGNNSAAPSRAEENQREPIAEFLESYDCNILITGLRSLNKVPGSTNYDEFWDEVN